MPGSGTARALLAGAATGLLYCVSLPKADQGWVAWVCLLPLLVVLLRHRPLGARQAAAAGLSAGLIAGLGRVYWVAGTLELYGGLGFVPAALTTALLILYLALYPALFALLCRRLPASPGWPWLAASVWVLLDWVQSWMASGFPWALLGYTQYRNGPVAQLAAFGGVHALTFLVVLVNAAVALALAGGRRLAALVPAVAVVTVVLVGGHLRHQRLAAEPAGGLRIGIVQGNIPQDVKWLTSRADSTTAHYTALTRTLIEEHGPLDLVVWPETALPFVLDRIDDRHHRARVETLARQTGTPLLVGSLGSVSASGHPGLYNRSFLIDAGGGLSGTTDKAHLVPFGEYLPFPRLFGYLGALTAQSGRFDPGEPHPLLFLPGGEAFGVFICYESIFPGIARSLARRGAAFLVNTTNDAWFGTSAAPEQHLAMAVLRAVETGRPVIRAANTGISCLIEPGGQIRHATRLFATAAPVAVVTPRAETTPYTRFGDWILVLAAGLLLGAAAVARRRRAARVRYQVEEARTELTAFARQPVPLSRPLILLPGYDSGPERWATFRQHVEACFVDGQRAAWIDLARDEPLSDLASHVAASLPDGAPVDFVGHSLGALVAAGVAPAGSRVFALAAPVGGTRLAGLARCLGFPLPRLLADLSPGSPALADLRARWSQMSGWIGRRLAGDPLSQPPRQPMAGTHLDYPVPLLLGPWARHRRVLCDPRVIRDVIARLRSPG